MSAAGNGGEARCASAGAVDGGDDSEETGGAPKKVCEISTRTGKGAAMRVERRVSSSRRNRSTVCSRVSRACDRRRERSTHSN